MANLPPRVAHWSIWHLLVLLRGGPQGSGPRWRAKGPNPCCGTRRSPWRAVSARHSGTSLSARRALRVGPGSCRIHGRPGGGQAGSMEPAVHPTSTKRGSVALTDQAPPAQRPATPAAHAVDLRKTYGTGQATVHALAGVDVTFERGRFTAVMGPSGSGKSTLMHCMAGLDRPTSGQTFVGDLDIGEPGRQGADPDAARPHRLRLPVVQPRPHAHRGREHHPAGRPGRAGRWTRSGSTTWWASWASATA